MTYVCGFNDLFFVGFEMVILALMAQSGFLRFRPYCLIYVGLAFDSTIFLRRKDTFINITFSYITACIYASYLTNLIYVENIIA